MKKKERKNVLLLLLLRRRRRSLERRALTKLQRRKIFWVREIFLRRKELGEYHRLFQELKVSDREYFFRYLRMSPDRFEHLLSLVGPVIQRQDTHMRESISAEQRLVITIRYLSSGDAQQSLCYSFRISKSTISSIISETCIAIYEQLKIKYLNAPNAQEDWLRIADTFEANWNMPHVIGAIDGKHIRIQCPKFTGTQYYNYKGFFSLVLMAVCDANYCFTMYDVGQFGSNNDSVVLANSAMGKALEEDALNVPKGTIINQNTGAVPFYLVGDEIFPLKTWLMRPYPGSVLTSEEKRIFNYRLSRARRVIENAFGILGTRWRIFHKPIKATVKNVEDYTLACLSLHNYLRQTDNAMYTPQGFLDSESKDEQIKEGEWSSMRKNLTTMFQNLNPIRGSRYSKDALQMRNTITDYVNSAVAAVSWQYDYIRRTSHHSFGF
ncbi:uncharacterized protein LOC130645634 [Hydractinia symbiolongicarpus]|uniref:uncharacterized protein LOC130645634 n=1 Tax=Hydractinia symbiolongicarpus TaxID=13093 RepID=UPI0025512D3F|nr:uncharacterized protein LOC130645634 [Hydractinia symbiolongicarpus]